MLLLGCRLLCFAFRCVLLSRKLLVPVRRRLSAQSLVDDLCC